MWMPCDWKDFEVVDAGGGMKLERWGPYHLLRPDPQALWPARGDSPAWKRIDATYHRSEKGGGSWEYHRKLPQRWEIRYGALAFEVGTLGFKHTGLFPEQAVNWRWMAEQIAQAARPVEVLNLFAYTGGATAACAAAGARVVHVDAARGMVQWARANLVRSGLADRPVRFIVDDCVKFVQREIRRGRRYQAILMDPPSYGRGPDGEMWKIEEHLFPLLSACAGLLTDDALFVLINSYTTGLQPAVLGNVLRAALAERRGKIEVGEVGLPISGDMTLPCGAAGRWHP
ncbi:MAG: SAM-dependent methyltransferase [Clostridiales bacterium]|nr:SAM-dependent methyltransferase [Clostridiales bacterium]